MKSMVLAEHGGSDRLQLVDQPTPIPGPGEVVVRVRAASLNHLDIWIRMGAFGKMKMPHIGGCDGAGEVDEIGAGVEGFSKGDRVVVAPGLGCGLCPDCLAGEDSLCAKFQVLGSSIAGTFSEYVLVNARRLVKVSDALTFEEWAALGVAYLTAWHMVFGRAKMQPGERVLVHAAGSGVGAAAIQLAKLAGGLIFTTSSKDDKLARARDELGADATANYATGDVAATVMEWTKGRGVDVVIDHVGPDTWKTNIASLRKGGRLVNCGVTSGPKVEMEFRPIYARQISLLGAYLGNRHEFDSLLKMADAGRIKPVLDRVFDLADLAAAQDYMDSRQQFGKIILRVP
ncbi:alcohol dehydrogenase [candidate division BRC1 bacterium HGW-BRC1-1]|jgi:NADPH:quinone reductase-like Zn-dependent oxidoreductase|nr:MAG: alcohol dehydrogenase [candidate division BRC1 bacterium HGW-BRC1-1]